MSNEAPLPISIQMAENIKKQGFLAVPVQTINEEAETSRYFGGSFLEFVETAKALGEKCIFIETLYLEDEDFFYDSGLDDYDEDDDYEECDSEQEPSSDKETAPMWLDPEDLDGMDLSLLKPELENYDKRLGEECGVRLTLPGPDHIVVDIFTDWYDKFANLVDEASEEIEADPKAALKKMQEAYARENAEDEHS